MPEHLRALIFLLAMTAPALWLFSTALPGAALDRESVLRYRRLWLLVTLYSFLSHNFWLNAVLCALTLSLAQSKDRNPLALYCAVLFAAPHFSHPIPGIGPIEHFFELNHIRLLAIVILVPLAFRAHQSRGNGLPRGSHRPKTDIFVFAYILLILAVQAVNDSPTGTIRTAFYLLIDIYLPYYTASRFLTSTQRYIEVATALVMAAVLLGIIATYETARNWLLYETLRLPLDLPPTLTMYLVRFEGGALRANASVGNAIVLGYVLMFGLAGLLLIADRLRRQWVLLGAACITSGLIATVSRGPWVGSAAVLILMTCLAPNFSRRLVPVTLGAGAAITVLLISPIGKTIIDYLPFVGTVDPGSVDYRAQLWDVSLDVFWQSPLLGNYDYLSHPLMEQMRQGQGIIDMVNTYLQVALPYGAIGLALFSGAFLSASRSAWTAKRKAGTPEVERIARSFFALTVGVMLTIATVSSIGVIPQLYWMLIGCCSGLGLLVATSNEVTTGPDVAVDSDPAVLGRARPNLPQTGRKPADPHRQKSL